VLRTVIANAGRSMWAPPAKAATAVSRSMSTTLRLRLPTRGDGPEVSTGEELLDALVEDPGLEGEVEHGAPAADHLRARERLLERLRAETYLLRARRAPRRAQHLAQFGGAKQLLAQTLAQIGPALAQ